MILYAVQNFSLFLHGKKALNRIWFDLFWFVSIWIKFFIIIIIIIIIYSIHPNDWMFTNNLTIINGMYQSLLDHCLYVIFLYCCVIFFQFCYQCNNTVIKQLVFDVVFLFMFVFSTNTNLLLAFIISLLCKFLNNEKEIITIIKILNSCHLITSARKKSLQNWQKLMILNGWWW